MVDTLKYGPALNVTVNIIEISTVLFHSAGMP